MGKKKSMTIGYRYYFGIQMGLCRGPIDDLVEIRVGGRTAWKGTVQGTIGRIFIDAYNLFGGEKGEGGVQGTFDLFTGAADQGSITPLESMVGGKRPSFFGVATAFFDGIVTMINPYPKPWEFRVRRSQRGWEQGGWYVDKATILMTRPTTPSEVTSSAEIHAMNPAHIIYECMTNNAWGRGLDPALLDTTAFRIAADRLHDEGFGLCLKWSRRDSLKSFIGSVVDHIGAALYNDPTSGLLTLKLIRHDYVREALPIFTVDTGLLSVQEAPVGALAPMLNECTVTFRDPLSNKDQTVGIQNLASIQAANGNFNSVNRKFPGLPTPELALRVAQRELRAQSVALRRFKLVLDRRAWALAPGGVFRIKDAARNIPDTVVRIGRMDRGTLLNGQITIDAVTDVFSFPLASYIQPVYPPDKPKPEPKPTESKSFELPYFMLHGATSPADFSYIPNEAAYLGTVAVRPDPMHGGYDIAVRDGAPTYDDNPTS